MSMRWQYRVTAILLSLFGLTSFALAEVADKMPTATHIWSYAAPLALLTFFCARFKPVIGVIAMVFTFFLNPGCGVWQLNYYLHGAVAAEMGVHYMLNAYLAIFVPPLFGLLGIVNHSIFRRRKVAAQ